MSLFCLQTVRYVFFFARIQFKNNTPSKSKNENSTDPRTELNELRDSNVGNDTRDHPYHRIFATVTFRQMISGIPLASKHGLTFPKRAFHIMFSDVEHRSKNGRTLVKGHLQPYLNAAARVNPYAEFKFVRKLSSTIPTQE